MNIVPDKIASIVYESASTNETSARTIIPVAVPNDNILAIDVSDLTPDERVEMARLYAEYRVYKDTFLSRMYKFEDWTEQTSNVQIKPKWRTFKRSGLR